MSIYHLTATNFQKKDGHIYLNINNGKQFTLVFFYASNCKFCGPAYEVYQQIPQRVQGCGFGMINITDNYSLSEMSRESSTPITYVPLIILYFQGRPVQLFKNTYTVQNLLNFIQQASTNTKTRFAQQKPQEEPAPVKKIPEYSIGQPYCDEDTGVCYLSFESAYKAKTNGNNQR